MDPFAPICGISIERYADLAADVSEISDGAEQALVVARKGVSTPDWEAAKAGWTARMQDPASSGAVAARFVPLYQAALARRSTGVSGAMPGAVPPGYAQHAPPGYAQAPGYAPPAAPYPRPPGQAYPPQPGYNPNASAFGNEIGNAFNAFGNALDSFVSGAASGMAPGAHVLVTWSNGQRYPGTVMRVQSGQVHVAFPDGQQVWVPQHVVTLRSAGF
ncbi:MAG: hypothetical protein JWP97_1818 [Labilithrix sp.]|nr:hypothetical protein [Labilithrix sp.]